MALINKDTVSNKMSGRILKNKIAKVIFFIATIIGLLFLGALAYRILTQGLGSLDMDFLTGFTSQSPDRAGIKAGVIGSLWLMSVTAPVTLIIGVATAIYLEEYAKRGKFTRFIQIDCKIGRAHV